MKSIEGSVVDLPHFQVSLSVWRIIRLFSGNVQLDSFATWLCLRGTRTWYDRGLRLLEFRDLVHQYPMFNMTIFVFDSTIFDVILTTVDVTVRAVICTLISMIIVCALFIPSHGCLLVATCSIASIVVCTCPFTFFASIWAFTRECLQNDRIDLQNALKVSNGS